MTRKKKPLVKETLFDRRLRQRDFEISELIQSVDLLIRVLAHQKKYGHNANEIARTAAPIVHHAHLAAMYARMVEDLDDVATYGPGGGR